MTVTIYYTRNGETSHYTFVGTPMERDAEIAAMLRTPGVTSVWYNWGENGANEDIYQGCR